MNPIEEVAEDLATAVRTGAVPADDRPAAMRLVTDLLRAKFPDAPPPPKLEPFSILVGAAFSLGVHKATGCKEEWTS